MVLRSEAGPRQNWGEARLLTERADTRPFGKLPRPHGPRYPACRQGHRLAFGDPNHPGSNSASRLRSTDSRLRNIKGVPVERGKFPLMSPDDGETLTSWRSAAVRSPVCGIGLFGGHIADFDRTRCGSQSVLKPTLVVHVVLDKATRVVAEFPRDLLSDIPCRLQSRVRFHRLSPQATRVVSPRPARKGQAKRSLDECGRTCSRSQDADNSRLPENRTGW